MEEADKEKGGGRKSSETFQFVSYEAAFTKNSSLCTKHSTTHTHLHTLPHTLSVPVNGPFTTNKQSQSR